MFNDTVEYTPDRTGRKLQLPCLVNEHNEIVLPLLRYAEYLAGEGYSQSHLAKVHEAVRLFFEYSLTNAPAGGFGKREVGKVEHWRHFSRFRAAVIFGTFDSTTAQDPSGLCWPASTIQLELWQVRYTCQLAATLVASPDSTTLLIPTLVAARVERITRSGGIVIAGTEVVPRRAATKSSADRYSQT